MTKLAFGECMCVDYRKLRGSKLVEGAARIKKGPGEGRESGEYEGLRGGQ